MVRITRSVVPNLLTIANLFSGFIAIVYVSKENYILAAVFVLVASLFDMMDGITARLINSTSEFGVELDSLSDVVSFGVVPSFMLYKIHFYQYNDLGILISALPLICGVLRLARFNLLTSVFEDKKFFVGLAIPAGAYTIISYLIFYYNSDFFSNQTKEIFIWIVTIFVSISMITTVKFYNAPRPSKKYIRENKTIVVLFLIGLVLAIFSRGYSIFPFFVLYILFCYFRHFYLFFKNILKVKNAKI